MCLEMRRYIPFHVRERLAGNTLLIRIPKRSGVLCRGMESNVPLALREFARRHLSKSAKEKEHVAASIVGSAAVRRDPGLAPQPKLGLSSQRDNGRRSAGGRRAVADGTPLESGQYSMPIAEAPAFGQQKHFLHSRRQDLPHFKTDLPRAQVFIDF